MPDILDACSERRTKKSRQFDPEGQHEGQADDQRAEIKLLR